MGGRVVRATGLVWSEPEKPAFWSRTITAHFRLKLESIELPGGIERPNAIVNVNHIRKMSAMSSQRWLITLSNALQIVVSKRQAHNIRTILQW